MEWEQSVRGSKLMSFSTTVAISYGYSWFLLSRRGAGFFSMYLVEPGLLGLKAQKVEVRRKSSQHSRCSAIWMSSFQA